MLVTPMAMVVVMNLLLLGLLGLFTALVDGLDIIIEDCSNDGNHVGLNDACADIFCASDSYVDDTLESKIPFPHAHHVLATPLLKDADQTFDTAIDSEDVANTGRRCGKVGEMVERIDEGKSRGAVKGTAVI